MSETHSLGSLRARRETKRARGHRLGASLEQLEVRRLMSADDPTWLATELHSDPVAEPAVLVPSGNPNTTAESLLAAGGPGDPTMPGFNNVARSGDNGTVVYLGAGWAITANHVGLTPSITWAGQSYTVDTTSVTRLKNPDGSSTDLKMFRVFGDPPLPEMFTSYIAAAPATGRVIMVGNGFAATGQHYWSVDKTVTPWVWTEIAEPANPNWNNYAGVSFAGPRTVRWGENTVNDSGMYLPIGGVNVAGFTTRFDRAPYTSQSSLRNEGQASSGDSGGAVFSLEHGQWVLSGIMLAVSGASSGQPGNTAVYGSITFMADLSVYRSQILSIAGVVNRQLIYNNSAYDNNTPGVGVNEDAALAADKVAYQAGTGTTTFDNVSSYSRGINSIAVDIASLHGQLTASDFSFKVGVNSSVGSWTDAPAPLLISVRPGAGVGGSDRVQIIWPDAAIYGVWLEVTVKGNDSRGGFNTNTGLAKSDVFYFGHRPGDTGGTADTAAITSFIDELGARLNPAINESVLSRYDFDKNKIVSVGDQLFARANVGILLMLNLPAGAIVSSLTIEDEQDTSSGLIELPPAELPMAPPMPSLLERDLALAEWADPQPQVKGLFTSGLLAHAFLRKPQR